MLKEPQRLHLGMLALGTAAVVLAYQPDMRSLGAGLPLANTAIEAFGAPPLPESLLSRNLLPFTDRPWDRLLGGGWDYLKRSSSSDADIVVDATAPFSPPNVLRIVFTPNLEHDRQPTVHWTGLPFVSEVYATWWIKLSPNWTPSPAGAGKMAFLWPPQGNGLLYSNIAGSSLPHHVNIVTTWPAYGYKFWEPNVATTEVSYNRWYRIEWYVKWESSPGADDGIIRWWVNGTLNGDYSDLRFPACCLLQFEFAPTLQNPPPADQYMYIDHTWIATP
jgi:hypothetical protein